MKRIHLILVGLLLWAGGYAQELEKFKEDGKWGFRDVAGNVVVPAKYDEAGDFSEGLAPVMLIKENKMLGVVINTRPSWGYIDKTGKEVIPLKYTHAESFSGGFARVDYDFIDKTGTEIFKPVLEPYLKQTDRLLKKGKSGLFNQEWNLKKSAKVAKRDGSFNVKSPYLIVTTKREILKYSENNIDVQMMNRVKTLIVKEDLYIYRNYQTGDYSSNNITIKSYGTTLLYFDMETKKYLGRDFVEPAWLPTYFKGTQATTFGYSEYFPLEEVVKMIESRLVAPIVSADHPVAPLATIKVIRLKSMLGAVGPYQVYINDEFVGLVKNGEILEIPVFTSHNVVIVADGIGPFEGNFTVDLEKGGYAEVYVKARKFVEK